jgi:hypothetical protein
MKFFSIFVIFYLFSPCDKLFLGFILNLENAEMWSPPVIGPVARRRMVIGRAGRHSPVAARVGIIRPCRKPPPRCPNARTSQVRSSLRYRPLSHAALLLRAGPAVPPCDTLQQSPPQRLPSWVVACRRARAPSFVELTRRRTITAVYPRRRRCRHTQVPSTG